MSRLDRTCNVAVCANPVWAREMCRKHYMRWYEHGDPAVVLVKHTPAGEPAAFIDTLPTQGDGCVRWPFATNNMGYAQINDAERGKQLVTRIVCERHHGPPPTARHQAAHSCGKGHEACVAPWHLSWKTAAENMADLDLHGTRLRGERAPGAKLSEAQVREIQGLCGSAPQAKVAARFGVSQTVIGRIWRGEAWTHISSASQGAAPSKRAEVPEGVGS